MDKERLQAELAGWELLAERWRNVGLDRTCYYSDYGTGGAGLCEDIRIIETQKLIDDGTRNDMQLRLRNNAKNRRYKEYWWPRTLEGSLHRVQFCLDMIEQCKKEQEECDAC